MSAKNIVIIGGAHGMCAQTALRYRWDGHNVTVTGRSPFGETDFMETALIDAGAQYRQLAIGDGMDFETITEFVGRLPMIDEIIFAAGFPQIKALDKISFAEINSMNLVKSIVPQMITAELLRRQGCIPVVTGISSTSAFTPRLLEQPYNAANAGLQMFLRGLALDSRVGKVRIIAPSGTATRFWSPEHLQENGSQLMSAERAGDLIYEIIRCDAYMMFAIVRRLTDDYAIIEAYQTPAMYSMNRREPV
jgi:short-subunit dehydrogenase